MRKDTRLMSGHEEFDSIDKTTNRIKQEYYKYMWKDALENGESEVRTTTRREKDGKSAPESIARSGSDF